MMYSAYKLNKQGDNTQPWCTPWAVRNQSIVPCLVQNIVSSPAYMFLRRGKVVWYSHIFKNFPQFAVIHKVKDFSVVNEAEVYVFLEFSYFLYDPTEVGNSVPDSSAFSKSSLYIWKFLVHVLLKPSLKYFEHYLASMWSKWNCMIVWTFFDVILLCNCNENWLFQVTKLVDVARRNKLLELLFYQVGNLYLFWKKSVSEPLPK